MIFRSAAAWTLQNIKAYKDSARIYPRNVFAEKTILPRTEVDTFLTAVDHAMIDIAISRRMNRMVLVGKWIIKVDKREADEVWETLERDIGSGTLPYRAKISTARRNPDLRDVRTDERQICIYTPNFLWRENVREVRRLLTESGFRSRLYYRPDVFTVLEFHQVAKTYFNRKIFSILRTYGVHRLKAKYRYFG
jgi:hypothetical protein